MAELASLPSSHAAALPPRAGTRHDPFRARLDPATAWRAAVDEAGMIPGLDGVVERCGALELAPVDDDFWDEVGSLGGLALPRTVAIAPNGDVFLLHGTVLRILDPCACAFAEVPGVVAGIAPVALAIRGQELLIADPGAGVVHVRNRRSLAQHRPLVPPPGAAPAAWQPAAVAANRAGRIAVGDPANGMVHVFVPSGGYVRGESGLGAVTALAVDREGALWVVRGPGEPAIRLDPATGARTEVARVSSMRHLFPGGGVYRAGRLALGGYCVSGEGQFTLDGSPAATEAAPAPGLGGTGTLLAGPIDSRIHDCRWDVVSLVARTPAGCRIVVETQTANALRPLALVESAPAAAWAESLALGPRHEGPAAAPVRSPRGRWLWLRVRLSGPGTATPVLCRVDLAYPRRGLAAYLPEVVRAEPQSAEFTERFLGIFEEGERSIERQIDRQAALFDADTAPSAARPERDVLGWLASWIGLALDRGLPEATRRRVLKTARRDLARAGTLGAMRNGLLALIGIDPHAPTPPCRAACVPCKAPASPEWTPPMLVLEHFRLRRWLIAGLSRLDATSELWGQRILNHTILDEGARLGTTVLNTYQDPWRGPFHRDAHRFSVFLPAWIEREPATRRAARALIEANRPAQTAYAIHYVGPAMRIGQQARLGFDAVIARRVGERIELGRSRLGKAGVLASDAPPPTPGRLGLGLRLRPAP